EILGNHLGHDLCAHREIRRMLRQRYKYFLIYRLQKGKSLEKTEDYENEAFYPPCENGYNSGLRKNDKRVKMFFPNEGIYVPRPAT
ncbi:MAG: hypothetical protein J5733_10240, partial [Bacteroidaceae bacterium]|nr:hypothetical protein [Bacteroidaceae bacterium]